MASTKSFRHLLLLLAVALLSLFRRVVAARRLLSFVSLRELLLHLSFLRCGLRPVTLDLGHASLHIWGPTPRRADRKSALLLIHGFGGNSKWQWERQIGVLSRSFDLYIPDLVFFGRSRSSCADRSVGYQARCVAEAMRLLGAARYSVMGISYGGFVAFRLAEMEAESVERVAILTAGICMTPEQLREMSAKEKRDVCEMLLPQKADDLRTLVNRSMYRPPKWIPSFFLQDFIEVMYRDQRKERVELLTKLLDDGIDQDPVPVLTQDTLILWGDKDAIFPLPLAHQLQRHLGEKAKLEVIEDAGHALQLEKADKLCSLLKSKVESPNFLEKLGNIRSSVSQNIQDDNASWNIINATDSWEDKHIDGENGSDEDYVLVNQEDVVDSMANFMAAYLLSLKKTKELTPDQLQEVLCKAFSVKKRKSRLRKAWQGSQIIYNVASWGATAIGIYQNPAIVESATVAIWSSCNAISKLF